MDYCYLVFVGKSGVAVPIGIYDAEYQVRHGVRRIDCGSFVSVVADDIGDACQKAKDMVKGDVA